MRTVRGSQNSSFNYESIPLVPTAPTGPSVPASSATTFAAMPGRAVGGGQTDGVFANLSAKPTVAEKLEEHPPVSLEKSWLEYGFHGFRGFHAHVILQ